MVGVASLLSYRLSASAPLSYLISWLLHRVEMILTVVTSRNGSNLLCSLEAYVCALMLYSSVSTAGETPSVTHILCVHHITYTL